MVPPDLVEVGQRAIGYAPKEAHPLAVRLGEGRHKPPEEFEDDEPADIDDVDDDKRVDGAEKVDVDVELREDIVGRYERVKSEETVLYAAEIDEVVEVFHAGGVGQWDFGGWGQQPGGDVDVVVDKLHH